MEQIGEVEILRTRVYPLDAALRDEPHATTVVVEPGSFPLYQDGISRFWLMSGRVNVGRMHRLGDGIFALSGNDQPSDVVVTFPSRVFGPDEWAEFVAEPACSEGSHEQRLRIVEFASR